MQTGNESKSETTGMPVDDFSLISRVGINLFAAAVVGYVLWRGVRHVMAWVH